LGCLFLANTDSCQDGNACTTGDLCSNGNCTPGTPTSCTDGNVCTDDTCVPATGCEFPPVADNTTCGGELICLSGVCSAPCQLISGSQTLSANGAIQTFTVPDCVETLTIEVSGGQGGKNNPCVQQGGKGARMRGEFTVTPGEVLQVIVGERGKDRGSNDANESGTGGGGSFVYRANGPDLLIAAGGGGAGAICSSGGSPAFATGQPGVTNSCGTNSTSGNGLGGCNGADGTGEAKGKGWNTVQTSPQGYGSGATQGGFGGGGTVGASHGGGGGGGYSGGGGWHYTGNPAPAGGGGGSINNGSNQNNADGVQSGHGTVSFTW
jgi:hypothetical protein